MLRFFRVISVLEGVSNILVFFNMLVVKNIDKNFYNTLLFPVGMAHGLLFILYIILATYLKFNLNWSFGKYLKICIASLIPFGTFYSDKYWLKN